MVFRRAKPKAQETAAKKAERILAAPWFKRVKGLGGIDGVLFGDVSTDQLRKAVLG